MYRVATAMAWDTVVLPTARAWDSVVLTFGVAAERLREWGARAGRWNSVVLTFGVAAKRIRDRAARVPSRPFQFLGAMSRLLRYIGVVLMFVVAAERPPLRYLGVAAVDSIRRGHRVPSRSTSWAISVGRWRFFRACGMP